MESYVKKKFIKKIEKEYSIKIIFVTECGSRAYGLESKESDYDMRFIYIQKSESCYEDYMNKKLSVDLFTLENVSKETITDVYTNPVKLDWQGWDITKAIRHLYEMNPSIYEWIFSPVVYYNNQNYQFMERAKKILNKQKRISPIIRHYRSMGRKYFEEYVEDEEIIKIKKYTVLARCCIMVKWLLLFGPEFLDDKEFSTKIFHVLEETRPFLNKKVYHNLKGMLEKKKRNAADSEMAEHTLLNKWFREILYETDEEYENIKESEDYTEESFVKYNQLLRSYFKKKFNN